GIRDRNVTGVQTCALPICSWARHSPAHFRFAAKVPRIITHDAALENVADAMASFVSALEPLGEKLGPLLVQLPAEFARAERTVEIGRASVGKEGRRGVAGE